MRTQSQARERPDYSVRKVVAPSIALAVVLGLTVFGHLISDRLVWSIAGWDSLNATLSTVTIVLFCLSLVPIASRNPFGTLAELRNGLNQLASGVPPVLLQVFGGILIFAILFLFKARTHFYGDGYLVIAAASEPLMAPLQGDEVLKPLTVYLFRIADKLFGDLVAGTGISSFGLISCLAGVCAAFGLRSIYNRHFEGKGRGLYWLIVSATSSTLLFAGHVEHYAPAVAACVWIVNLAMTYASRETGMLKLLLAVTIASCLHAVMVVLFVVPAVLYVTTHSNKRGRNRTIRTSRRANLWGASLVAVSILSVAVAQYLFDLNVFVPPFPAATSPYWAFSVDHLIDLANALLFAAPLALALLISSLFDRQTTFRTDPVYLASLACFLPLLLACFWIDPVLGAGRDWDLLTLFALPMAICGAKYFLSSTSDKVKTAVTAPLVIMALAYLIPAMVNHRSTDRSLEQLDSELWVDPHYETSYHQAERAGKWAAILIDHSARSELAIKYCLRRLEAVPGDDLAHYNLATAYYRLNSFDSASVHYGRAYALAPENEKYKAWTANALGQSGRSDSALVLLQKEGARIDGNLESLRAKGILLAEKGDLQAALEQFRLAYSINPNSAEENVNLAISYDRATQFDSAAVYFRRALPIVPENIRCEAHSSLVRVLMELGNRPAAKRELEEFTSKCPSSQDAAYYRQQMSGW